MRLGYLLLLTLTGCMTAPPTQKFDLAKPELGRSVAYLKKLSSGFVGCDPAKISVKNLEAENFAYESIQTWQAACNGETFYCTYHGGYRGDTYGGGPIAYTACTKGRS